MRIIAGEWRRRLLQTPPGDATRPTADRTRETLFAMLTSRLGSFEGLAVGDLFAGSGALGLEALSRGAQSCLFVEHDAPAICALRANIAALRAQAQCEVRASSVLHLGPAKAPLDLLLLDPLWHRRGRGGARQARAARLDRTGELGRARDRAQRDDSGPGAHDRKRTQGRQGQAHPVAASFLAASSATRLIVADAAT